MKTLQSLLRKPFLSVLLLILFLEFLPVPGKEAAALRLYEGSNLREEFTTYYVLQPDGDLISWGKGPLDHVQSGSYRSVPYVQRRRLARGVLDFACTPFAMLYVDEDHVLRGSGSDIGILRRRGTQGVWLMADVEQVVANDRRALALKTDGSLWTWLGDNTLLLNRKRGMNEENVPEKIGENIRSIFLVNGDFFAIANDDTLLYWDVSGDGELKRIAQNAEAVSALYIRGEEIYQYLDRQGNVYTIRRNPSMKAAEKPIADNVISLCEEGFIRKDHSLWTWQGTSENGMPVKTRSGVQAAANPRFYVGALSRLHWRTSTWRMQVPSQSVRWLNPDSRKMEVLILGLLFLSWLLHKLLK